MAGHASVWLRSEEGVVRLCPDRYKGSQIQEVFVVVWLGSAREILDQPWSVKLYFLMSS